MTILLPSLVKAIRIWANCYFLVSVSITNCGSVYTQAFLTPQTFSLHFSDKNVYIISLLKNSLLTAFANKLLLWMISFFILTLDYRYIGTKCWVKYFSTSSAGIYALNLAINCIEIILFSSSSLFYSYFAILRIYCFSFVHGALPLISESITQLISFICMSIFLPKDNFQ